MSVVIHEVAHGLAALSQGDRTAEYEGRLTLNPIKHIDPFGSIILPLLCYLLPGSLMFGWAKPVPYNPYNLRNGRLSEMWVAFAGPLSNLFLAIVAGLVLRGYATLLPVPTVTILVNIVLINLVLAVFNLVPLPPLDGSKILLGLFPKMTHNIRNFFEKYGLFATFFFIFFLWQYCAVAISLLFTLITGIRV
jgi:Zn-dependent protease